MQFFKTSQFFDQIKTLTYVLMDNFLSLWSYGYNIIPLPYPDTQSLLPSLFMSQFYTSPKNLHTNTIINETSITRYKYNYRAEIYFYFTTLFLLNLWSFYYYQSIYFLMWTHCELRYSIILIKEIDKYGYSVT